MKNFIELFKVLENHTDYETLAYLMGEHRQEIIDEAMKIKHNNSTRKAALSSYIKGVGHIKQDEEGGIYCDGHSVVNVCVKSPRYNEEAPGFKFLLEAIKAEKHPAPLRASVDYAIATAKCNGWKMGDTNFFVKIGASTYNLSLLAKVFNCIADPKTYNDVRIEQINGDREGCERLLLSTQYGVGLVLPFKYNGVGGFYNVTPSEGALETLQKRLDDKLMQEVRGEAVA